MARRRPSASSGVDAPDKYEDVVDEHGLTLAAQEPTRQIIWCDDERVSEQPPSTRAVFRPARLSILAALLLAVCATPVAFGAPFLWLIYLVPLAMIAWVLRVRTVVDAEALTVRRVIGTRRVPWPEISSLRLSDKARVRAVLTDGAELPLPSVHIRDLPQLAAASGGRLDSGDD